MSMASSVSMAARREVESALGKGTKFTICLPTDRKKTAAMPGVDRSPLEESERVPGSCLNARQLRAATKRALIVDDEVHVRSLIARWLTRRGLRMPPGRQLPWRPATISATAACIWSLSTSRLPGRRGTDLLEEIFAICPDVVVLMVTATQEARTAIDVLRRGASGYLVKPVSREQLILQARKTIAQRQMLIERRQYTERLEQQIRQQTVAIRHAHEETIHRLVAASSCRDVETSMHILRTGLLCRGAGPGEGLVAGRGRDRSAWRPPCTTWARSAFPTRSSASLPS